MADQPSDYTQRRREKVEKLRSQGANPFPNDFSVPESIGALRERYEQLDAAALEKVDETHSVAGRILALRRMGRSAFLDIRDRSTKIQLLADRKALGDRFGLLDCLDVGDFVGAVGTPFRTRSGELTLRLEEIRLLAKSLRPLPEKWHGLTDIETRFRQRYLDLIANERVREIFLKRARMIQTIRNFLLARDFLEVETPMMQPIAGGALARPFVTHHNALGLDFYLRIAPELYLKRLVVGGLERVFEINRNFRNEGLSTQHNPEFTMLEFYQAYATYEDLMALTEELLCETAREVNGALEIVYQGKKINLGPPWRRLPVESALEEFAGISPREARDAGQLASRAESLRIDIEPKAARGKIVAKLIEQVVEPHLEQPTFLIDWPVEISPLARSKDSDPGTVERFELFIAGMEIANAFSELNDPDEQRRRFEAQIAERRAGDEEAHRLDRDFLLALEHGMPPTAGEGIGIDRLAMLLTDSPSIREVILFPQLRGEAGAGSHRPGKQDEE